MKKANIQFYINHNMLTVFSKTVSLMTTISGHYAAPITKPKQKN